MARNWEGGVDQKGDVVRSSEGAVGLWTSGVSMVLGHRERIGLV